MSNNSVLLTKQAAAHRLLLGAVRYFQADHADPIVVHVIAASALNMMRELISSRGTSFVERTFAAALYEHAHSRVEDREPIFELPYRELMEPIISDLEAQIRSGQISSHRDVNLTGMPRNLERKLLDHILEPYNFLKHADRDPNGSIALSDLKPIEAIVYAINAYSILYPAAELDDDIRVFLAAYLR